MKLRIILIVTLLLIVAKTLVVKTHSTYTITSSYTISIIPKGVQSPQQSDSSALSDHSGEMN